MRAVTSPLRAEKKQVTSSLYFSYSLNGFFHTEAAFWGLHPPISNGFVSSRIYDKRDDFDFDIVIFPFWMAMFHVVSY